MTTETFDAQDYWRKRGRGYVWERRLRAHWYRAHERAVLNTVRANAGAAKTAVELGCGFGRITRVLAEAMPGIAFTGLDISAEQIEHARIFCCLQPNAEFMTWTVEDAPLIPADVYLAFEFFLHVPTDAFKKIIARIFESTTQLIHDFDANPNGQAEHVFQHDYPKIYAEMGLFCAAEHRGEHSVMVVWK